ncbi:hypothetical protein WN943_020171 [Citrus x changshan-huyou]
MTETSIVASFFFFLGFNKLFLFAYPLTGALVHANNKLFAKIVAAMGSPIILYAATSCYCLVFFLFIIRLFNKLWWIPNRTQAVMGSQGVRGPAYRLVYGNTKEILSLRNRIWISPMGLSHDILPRILPHICSWTKQYGMNFLTWYGSRAQLVITQPELIKEILSNSDGTYPKVQAPGFLRKILGDGLVTAGGENWHRQRKLATLAFYAESLRDMIPAMVASVEIMLKRWRHNEGKEIEVSQDFTLLTSEIISRTAFGSSYLEGESIFNKLTNMSFIASRNAYKIKIPLIGDFVKTSDDVEADKLEQGIRDSIIKMMKTREEKAMKGESEGYGNDYFGLLLKAYHDPDMTKRISLDVLIDECKTFYIAGHETTTKLLTWTILLLATHTDWQEKLREEVLELFGQQNPTPDGIGKLKTMSMVINESLRLYPPAVNISRNVEREVRLGKYILPANMELVIPILAIHHDPQIWGEDVDLFKPERFAEGVAKASNNTPAAFLPFSSGPRICVGLNFAATEAKIALSMILQRYRFNLSPSYVHSPVLVVTLRPQHGLQVIFQPLSVNQRN